MKYVDLFCGIGGFHQGMERVFPDSECIFASDFDYSVSEVYKNTYGIDCYNDITLDDTHKLLEQKVMENGGSFDVLFAGFPRLFFRWERGSFFQLGRLRSVGYYFKNRVDKFLSGDKNRVVGFYSAVLGRAA